MSSKKLFIKNTIMQYLMVLAQYVFPLLTFPYLTRVLGNDAYGLHIYMTSVSSYFQLVVDFGFMLSATALISKNRDDLDYVQRILSETICAKLILFFCMIPILTGLIPFQSILKANISLTYMYMGTVFFSIFTADFLFRGIEKMEILTYRFVASKIVSTCLVFVLVHNSDDLFWVPLLNTAGSLVAVVMTWSYIYRNLKYRLVAIKFKNALHQIKESTVYFVSTIATTAFGAFTTIVMGFPLTTVQLSYWGTSYNLIATAQSLYSPITNSLFPHMVKNKDVKISNKILYIFMPIIVAACILGYIIAPYVILIMCGKSYLPGVTTFQYLIPVLLFAFPAMILGFPVLGSLGYVKDVTRSTVIAAIYHMLGITVLFVTGIMTIEYVALLRSSTEFILMMIRIYYCLRRKVWGKNNKTTYDIDC